MIGIMFLIFAICMILAIPVGFSIAISATAFLFFDAGIPIFSIVQKMVDGINSFSYLALPLFVLSGAIMVYGATPRLMRFANMLLGRLPGGIGAAGCLGCGFFGAISGSGVATASAIGGITIPAMQREGYPSEFSTAIASISSILGPIIPPSITLIVYASITNVSVSQLFMGSVIPGILLAGSLIVYALVYGKRNNLPAHEKQTPKQIGHAFKEGIWALLMPIIILGGIFGGIFTPTEAAAVAVVYALIISLTVYRDMKLSELPQVFVEASVSTATIMMMVGLSKASSYVVHQHHQQPHRDFAAAEPPVPDHRYADGGQCRHYYDDPHPDAAAHRVQY